MDSLFKGLFEYSEPYRQRQKGTKKDMYDIRVISDDSVIFPKMIISW